MTLINNELTIVCLSRSRADKLMTKKLFKGFRLLVVVPEQQLEEYKEKNPEPWLEIIAHPRWVRGIGDARYWVMTNFGDVFMTDDDVDHVRNYCVYKKAFDTIRDPEHINDIIHNCYNMAKQCGAKMWGFDHSRQPLEFSPQKPFRFSGFINASMCGYMKDHDLPYDYEQPWLNLAEDFYFSAMNAYKHRFCFVDERYTFLTVGNFNSVGGCSDYRRASDLDEHTKNLMKLFGDAIVYKRPTSTKKKLQAEERLFKVPF